MATGSPEKFLPRPCPTCGHPNAEPNPQWLRWQRERKGVALRELGRRLALSPQYLCDMEKGRRRCPDWVREAYEDL